VLLLTAWVCMGQTRRMGICGACCRHVARLTDRVSTTSRSCEPAQGKVGVDLLELPPGSSPKPGSSSIVHNTFSVSSCGCCLHTYHVAAWSSSSNSKSQDPPSCLARQPVTLAVKPARILPGILPIASMRSVSCEEAMASCVRLADGRVRTVSSGPGKRPRARTTIRIRAVAGRLIRFVRPTRLTRLLGFRAGENTDAKGFAQR
jgi:hypothetical protein